MVYYSFDFRYSSEILNSLNSNGMSMHALKLINSPAIPLRNIDPANGLCKGTSLVVRGFQRNTIDTEIMVGQHTGQRVFLPRIHLCPSDDNISFRFKRKQFQSRLSFAMKINRRKGRPF